MMIRDDREVCGNPLWMYVSYASLPRLCILTGELVVSQMSLYIACIFEFVREEFQQLLRSLASSSFGLAQAERRLTSSPCAVSLAKIQRAGSLSGPQALQPRPIPDPLHDTIYTQARV